MERIEINGFLTIDHADFEIRKINILIGAQAQGKSVIAKLIYFFKGFFWNTFLESIKTQGNKPEINQKCLAQFEQVFPKYTWINQTFSITYKHDNYEISISRIKKNYNYTLKFNYCKNLANIHNKLKNYSRTDFENSINYLLQEKKDSIPSIRKPLPYETVYQKIQDFELREIFQTPIFIPAGRSFFANLQKNVFSFLANNIDIDPFIKEFGFRYEDSKRVHHAGITRVNDSTEAIRKKIERLVNDIVSGEYINTEDQDWISNNGKRTNLANASSGQQEALPMLLILSIWPFLDREEPSTTFFIEEPEAHLFPVSQKLIISLIATIYNSFGHSFFITTHSPYILTAINNLVVGQDAYDKANGDPDKLKKLEEVLATDELIRLEDVSAYTLNKGKLESIIDMENRLIGANLLDTVSDEFDAAFNVATEILYGAE